MKHDWKKLEKDIYLPKTTPLFCHIPSFSYFCIEGEGNPNDPSFANDISALYALSYAIKMMPKKHPAPEGYFDYAIYPLEADWSLVAGVDSFSANEKENLAYTMMIRQPNFVTKELAAWALETTKEKKPELPIERVHFSTLPSGEYVQMMHLGSYDNEPASFAKMLEFCDEKNIERTSPTHREIYIGNPLRTAPEKLRTVLRFSAKQK